jgi:hypothetical protein
MYRSIILYQKSKALIRIHPSIRDRYIPLFWILGIVFGIVFILFLLNISAPPFGMYSSSRYTYATADAQILLDNFDYKNDRITWHLLSLQPNPYFDAEIPKFKPGCVTQIALYSREDITPRADSFANTIPTIGCNQVKEGGDDIKGDVYFESGILPFYPYDTVYVNVYASFLANNIKSPDASKSSPITTTVNWKFDIPSWQVQRFPAEGETYNSPSSPPQIHLVLKRPFIYRIITPFLLLTLLIFILLIPIVNDLGALGQIAVGILFGLWGVRQILFLPDVQFFTFLDMGFAFLYIALIISVMYRLTYIQKLIRAKKPFPDNEQLLASMLEDQDYSSKR